MTPFSIFPENYQEQLDNKIHQLQQQLDQLQISHPQLTLPELVSFESPSSHYRMRAEFKIWHEGDISHYAMTDKATKQPVFLTEFPVANLEINRLMPKVMNIIHQHKVLRKKLFQIEFLSTLTDDTLITLIYHRPLDDEWIQAANTVKEELGVNIIGRSRKQKITLDRNYVNEELKVNSRTFFYQQNEGSFTQPNATICEKMLTWAVDNTKDSTGDLLELYCGNGNFTLPLSQNFNRVIATEISKSSVNSALKNIERNNITNVDIIRMSSEDFSQAMDKVREFRRLAHIDLDEYHFSIVLVDQPREGLDNDTLRIIQQFDRIIYISCNPTTLMDNLMSLCKTHDIASLAAFDQFPYTDHLEAGVILERRR